jgi:hypothetical protein
MGYFDGLTDASFKKDSQGRDLFFPWGVLGSGYILQTAEQKEKFRKFFKKMYLVVFATIIVVQSVFTAWYNVALLPVFYLWFHFSIKKMTKGLERSTEKLKTSEAYKNSAKSHSLTTLILLEIAALIFVAGGAFIINKGEKPIIGYFSIVFFGFCAIAIGYMIFSKLRKN